MTGWLLDTNVLSELRRPKPDPNVVKFVSAQSLDLLYVSVVTFAEIRFGTQEAAAPPSDSDMAEVQSVARRRLSLQPERTRRHDVEQKRTAACLEKTASRGHVRGTAYQGN